MSNKECATIFVNAIKDLAAKPENLDNLEYYLSNHFGTWLHEYASNPENLAYELKHFAEMEI